MRKVVGNDLQFFCIFESNPEITFGVTTIPPSVSTLKMFVLGEPFALNLLAHTEIGSPESQR